MYSLQVLLNKTVHSLIPEGDDNCVSTNPGLK